MRTYLKKLKRDILKECTNVTADPVEGENCCIFINEVKKKACFIYYNENQTSWECQKIDIGHNYWAKEEGFDAEARVEKLQDEIFGPMQISCVKEYLK